ncbi:restriction endonuclease subunit S, partial [Vibrio anguillarum]
IKRHGVPSDVAGQKLLVKKGQIIFGKRRAYQRKIAVADWDCICSAHAMVLEANSENVIPEFLPFFMQSDVFMNRAIEISEGSLSPTIKWKALASQDFVFPSKEKQVVLLRLLTEVDRNIEALDLALYSQEQLIEAIVNETLLCPQRVK